MKCMSVGIMLVLAATTASAKQAEVFYYSVDIGSDMELSDPNKQGNEWMDPGDIYDDSASAAGPQLAKDDFQILNNDPPPIAPGGGSPVPVGIGPAGLDMVHNYFDMDGEDQLAFIPDGLQGPGSGIWGPIVMRARPASGLFLNPDLLYISYDDDGAPGWWANSPTNVPTTIGPDRGSATNEVMMGVGWHTWLPVPGLPVRSETGLGLAQDPPKRIFDDDVDALDTRHYQYWFWTCDHEARLAFDPGDIYVTDTLATPPSPPAGAFITHAALGLADGVDVDAFEFCVTDDAAVLGYFNVPAGSSYFAVVFSVDDDDPTTVNENESGGLNPGVIYISLLNGMAPFALCDRSLEGDVDGIALEERDMDFGDAPDGIGPYSYPTLRVNDGAGHIIKDGVYLGRVPPDAEDDGQPSLTADLDEATTGDEDRFGLPPHWVGSAPSTLQIQVSTAGYVNLWVDFNVDGDWSDAGERLATDWPVSAGINAFTFTMPPLSLAGPVYSYLRIRFCTQTGVGLTGIAPDGEVEDYRVRLIPESWLESAPLDFGDAPVSYRTLLAHDGARHVFSASYGMGPSGSSPDVEANGLPDDKALGDDLNNTDDEDGVISWSPLVRGSNATVRVETWSQGYLSGWLDTNCDGVWSNPGERIFGPVRADVTNVFTFTVPLSASVGTTFARIRFNSYAGAVLPYGLQADGEVEDYRLTLYQTAPPGTSLVITNLALSGSLDSGGYSATIRWTDDGYSLYRLEACSNLVESPGPGWSDVAGSLIPTGSWTDVSSATQRFYRVVIPFTYP